MGSVITTTDLIWGGIKEKVNQWEVFLSLSNSIRLYNISKGTISN